MLATIAIEHLYATIRHHDVRVAYLFCNYKEQADQSTLALISALLKQLVQTRPEMATAVTNLYQGHSKRQSRPSFRETFEALQFVCSNYTTVYIVVDALDEYADEDGSHTKLIDKLCELQANGDVRLMVTSRFIHEISQKFQSNSMLEVRASEEDVRRFVAS